MSFLKKYGSLSLSHSHTHTHIICISHTPFFSLSLSHTHTHTHTISLSLTQACTHTQKQAHRVKCWGMWTNGERQLFSSLPEFSQVFASKFFYIDFLNILSVSGPINVDILLTSGFVYYCFIAVS